MTLTYQPKITFGDVRASCVRNVLVYYCRDHQCSHHIAISADRWPDHVRLSDIEPDFVCSACGKRGAVAAEFLERADGDWLKRAPWCIKSVHASASRRFGNERDRGNFRDLSSPMEN